MTSLQNLRELALAADFEPHPDRAVDGPFDPGDVARDMESGSCWYYVRSNEDEHIAAPREELCDYYAAASPATVLSLLDRLEQMTTAHDVLYQRVQADIVDHHDSLEAIRNLTAQRDAALARLEQAEAERDEARALSRQEFPRCVAEAVTTMAVDDLKAKLATARADNERLRAESDAVESLGRSLCPPASNEGMPGLQIIENVLADRAAQRDSLTAQLEACKAENERLMGMHSRFRRGAHDAISGLDDHGRAHMVVECRNTPNAACFCGMHISQCDEARKDPP